MVRTATYVERETGRDGGSDGRTATGVDVGVAQPLAGADGVTAGPGGVAPEVFRSVFRRHPAGVTVVTLDGPGGPVGFTATSLASLSLDPPLISLSIASSSSSWPAMLVASTVVVHLLARDAGQLAARFATSGVDRFAPPTRWTRLPTGEPHLPEAAAWLRCQVEHRLPTGDHQLVVARVLDARLVRTADPLLYHDGGYAGLVADDPA
ncbi:MAG: flavin reductase family protein [Frankia sp.]